MNQGETKVLPYNHKLKKYMNRPCHYSLCVVMACYVKLNFRNVSSTNGLNLPGLAVSIFIETNVQLGGVAAAAAAAITIVTVLFFFWIFALFT